MYIQIYQWDCERRPEGIAFGEQNKELRMVDT